MNEPVYIKDDERAWLARLTERWQPISTAPKEHGREILIACNCPYMMAVVEWLDAKQVMGEDFVSGWYISDGHNDPIWFRANPYMTHWMPLPSQPAKRGRK